MTARKRQHKADPVALVTAGALLLLCAVVLTSDRLSGAAAVTETAKARQSPSDEHILTGFARIALEREHGRDARPGADPGIAKWTGPVRVRIVALGPPDAEAREILTAQLALLARLTGLSVERVPEWRRNNFRVVFTTRDRFAAQVRASLRAEARPMAARLTRANCVGMFEQDVETQAIVRATVIIPLDHVRARGLLRRCIVEETTQVMGLPNDAPLPAPSVFDDRGDVAELSPLDRMLVRLLYHPALRPGMRREAAMRTARRALEELRRADAVPATGRRSRPPRPLRRDYRE